MHGFEPATFRLKGDDVIRLKDIYFGSSAMPDNIQLSCMEICAKDVKILNFCSQQRQHSSPYEMKPSSLISLPPYICNILFG